MYEKPELQLQAKAANISSIPSTRCISRHMNERETKVRICVAFKVRREYIHLGGGVIYFIRQTKSTSLKKNHIKQFSDQSVPVPSAWLPRFVRSFVCLFVRLSWQRQR